MAVTPVMAADPFQPLIEQLDSIISLQHVPSYSLTIVSAKKELMQHTSGFSNRKTNQKASEHTLYRIGSITKAFTSLAMLQLQEKRLLSLNDSLKAHVPDAPLRNAWQVKRPVTIGQLLEHSAGLLDLEKTEFDNNSAKPLSLREGIFLNSGRKVMWPAGLFYSYSNVGAGYAAYILETRVKLSYENYIKKFLFVPLDMMSASLLRDNRTVKNLATGYDTDGHTVIPYWHMSLRPFGAINSSAKEMGHFVRMLLNYGCYEGSRILSRESIKRMERPETTLAARAGLKYGYGPGNYQYINNGVLFHGHGGDGDGYLAHYAYSRELEVGYFVVINAYNYSALRKIRHAIEKNLTQGHRPNIPAEKFLSMKVMKSLTGTYTSITYRFPWIREEEIKQDRISIYLLNKTLMISAADGKTEPLYHVGQSTFRSQQDPVATSIFLKHKNSRYYISDIGNYVKQYDIK